MKRLLAPLAYADRRDVIVGVWGVWGAAGVWRITSVLAAAWLLAACAVPFGPGPAGSAESPTSRNRLYLEEQERAERARQTFAPMSPSDR